MTFAFMLFGMAVGALVVGAFWMASAGNLVGGGMLCFSALCFGTVGMVLTLVADGVVVSNQEKRPT